MGRPRAAGHSSQPAPLRTACVVYTTSGTWVLTPPAPAAVLVAAPVYPSCARPYPHVPAIAALVPQLVLPHAFCIHFKRAPPIMTADVADRCVTGLHGLPCSGALGLTGLSWELPCVPLPPAEVTNPPSWARATPADPTAPKQPSSGGAYTLYFNNLGGAQHHATALPATLEALNPDFVGLQECWDTTRAAALLPRRYAVLCRMSDGRGAGLLVAVRRSLLAFDDPSALCHDGHHWLAVLYDLFPAGRVLVINLHLRPHLRYRDWLHEVRQMDACVRRVGAALSLMFRDFNSTGTPRTPLAAALGPRGALHLWRRVLPPGSPTNFTTVAGQPRQTSIDHVSLRGPVLDTTHEVLPTPSSHVGLHVTFTLSESRIDPYPWRLFRWRSATAAEFRQFRAALSVVWGWLALAPTPAPSYPRALHAVAQQYIPRPHQLSATLRRLRRSPPPLDGRRPLRLLGRGSGCG